MIDCVPHLNGAECPHLTGGIQLIQHYLGEERYNCRSNANSRLLFANKKLLAKPRRYGMGDSFRFNSRL